MARTVCINTTPSLLARIFENSTMPPSSRHRSRSSSRANTHARWIDRPLYRPVLIFVTVHCLCHVAEAVYESFALSLSGQDDVPALRVAEEQAIFTYAKLLGSHSLTFLTTSIINEITDQVIPTWGLTIDGNELRLVWTNTGGAGTTVDRRLSVLQFLNIHFPSWCREQYHGPNVDPTVFTNFSQTCILRMVCRRRIPVESTD